MEDIKAILNRDGELILSETIKGKDTDAYSISGVTFWNFFVLLFR